MRSLHNSGGEHVANFLNGQFYSTSGDNVGHYVAREGIFVDMDGHYLGEVYPGNRLAFNNYSSYSNVSYGAYGNYGNIGNDGNQGNIGWLSLPVGYEDVDPAKLG